MLIRCLLLGLLGLLASGAARASGPAPCFPKFPYTNVVYGSIPAGVSARFDTYGVWVCEMPNGYLTNATLFTLSNVVPYIAKYLTGQWTKAQADADCTTSCVDPTPAEAAYLAQLQAASFPVALVAGAAGSPQNVYAASNPSTPVAGAKVIAGGRCVQGKKIPGTPLYSVQGFPNVAVTPATPLGDVYAQCSITFPLAPVPLSLTVSVPNAPNTVYTIAKTTDQVILLPVGTVPAGTACDTSQQITQGGKVYSVVPRSAVTWSANVHPLAAFAQCGS